MKNFEVAESFYNNRYENCQGSNFFVEDEVLYSCGHHFPVAMYIGVYVLLNGDAYSPSTSTHQSYIRQVVLKRLQIIIPFSALYRAIGERSNYDKIKVIDNTPSTNIPYTYTDKHGEEKTGYRHTLGGSVFEYEGRYFISGIDETGVKNLYFLTELVRPVVSFEDALEALKPDVVIEAEKNDVEVKRQGEWFFIKLEKLGFSDYIIIKDGKLPGNDNDTGHHIVSELIQKNNYYIVRGIVKHDRKEHKQLKLYDDVKNKKWWTVVHNEQVQSWSADGNVD